MERAEAALAYLNRNKLRYVDMLEPLRRGSAEVLYAGADGVLLYDRLAKAHMLASDTPAALEDMLPLMDGCDNLVSHQLWCKETLAARFGLKEEQICHQAAWLDAEPPAVPEFGGALRLLDQPWAPWLYRHYSHAFGGVAYMEGAIGRGIGEALLRGITALALSRGQYAFAQVFTDNLPSLALQRKAGLTVSEDILYWLF